MAGILYAVGVGPGDPELLTLKAVKVINKAVVIACPAKSGSAGTAYEIAKRPGSWRTVEWSLRRFMRTYM